MVSPPERFADMIDRHLDGIAAYCKPENKVSLGFVEGLNNKIRVFQRRGYGLRDEEYLRLKAERAAWARHRFHEPPNAILSKHRNRRARCRTCLNNPAGPRECEPVSWITPIDPERTRRTPPAGGYGEDPSPGSAMPPKLFGNHNNPARLGCVEDATAAMVRTRSSSPASVILADMDSSPVSN
jgi:hypothetical protein